MARCDHCGVDTELPENATPSCPNCSHRMNELIRQLWRDQSRAGIETSGSCVHYRPSQRRYVS